MRNLVQVTKSRPKLSFNRKFKNSNFCLFNSTVFYFLQLKNASKGENHFDPNIEKIVSFAKLQMARLQKN